MSKSQRDRARGRASDADALAQLGPSTNVSPESIPPVSDVGALRKLVAGAAFSREDAGAGSAHEAARAPDDDGRLDLTGVTRQARRDDAGGREPPVESSPSEQEDRGWALGAVFGIGLGLCAGWFLFGVQEGALPVAAEGPSGDRAPSPGEGAARGSPAEPATGSAQTKSGQAKSGQAKSGQAKSGQAKSGQARSGQADPSAQPGKAGGPQAPGTGVARTTTATDAAPQAQAAPGQAATAAAPGKPAGPAAAAAVGKLSDRSAYRSIDRPTTGPRTVTPPATRAERPTDRNAMGTARPSGKAAPSGPGAPKPGGAAARARTDTPSVQAKVPQRGPRAVDKLLDEALAEEPDRRTAFERATAAQALPQTPGKGDLVGAMKVVLPAIRACAMGMTGVATVSLTIANTGRVQAARVTDAPFAGTAAGRCIEGVARKARFPKFAQQFFRVRVPLAIQ